MLQTPEKEERYFEVIREAFFALNGYRCPSYTKERQRNELARCFELLAGVVYGDDECDE